MCERVQPTETLSIITEDPSDNRILECAAAGQVDCIVSGDGHLLKLEVFRNAPILKVADFLKRVQKELSKENEP
jgi:predicted nucleic acid-binding protein